jgi:hypothetical protein
MGTLQYIAHSPTIPGFITCSIDNRVRFFHHRDQSPMWYPPHETSHPMWYHTWDQSHPIPLTTHKQDHKQDHEFITSFQNLGEQEKVAIMRVLYCVKYTVLTNDQAFLILCLVRTASKAWVAPMRSIMQSTDLVGSKLKGVGWGREGWCHDLVFPNWNHFAGIRSSSLTW